MTSTSPSGPAHDPYSVILLEGAVTAFVSDAWLTGAAFLGGVGMLYLVARWRRRHAPS